ncbi:hypothetical protein BpHYR1_048554 [Brachionus plicatilis]|uniref:Uncharacterized protein n=1 Tax=Brachionus plicatilis TaxID=10195 RepID=A0A3M7SJE9_BRAPC|nr:hypothetical protein BpHYR1_048554 [Brachionus plicatilis]
MTIFWSETADYSHLFTKEQFTILTIKKLLKRINFQVKNKKLINFGVLITVFYEKLHDKLDNFL